MSVDSWSILNDFALRRRKFNPESRIDLKELSYFKKNNKWQNGCPFYVEWPFQDVVHMCQSKYTDFMLSKLK